jgi:DNA-binding IclR family transcriptional regulator
MNAEAILNEAPAPVGPEIRDELVIGDLETLRALTDRTRLRLIEAFSRGGGEPRTVKDVAAELGEPPTKLYYHVNMLEQHGLLVVAGSRLVSGIVEKRYAPAARDFRVDRALLRTSGAAVSNILESAADDLRVAFAASAIDAGDGRTLIGRGELRLTEDQARRLRAALAEIMQTPDSTDQDAGDYTITIAFHPVASTPAET